MSISKQITQKRLAAGIAAACAILIFGFLFWNDESPEDVTIEQNSPNEQDPAIKTAVTSSTVPTPINLVMTAPTSSALTMYWKSGGGATSGYFLAFANGTVPPICTNGMRFGGTAYSRNDLKPGQTISMSVCATDRAGNVSPQVSFTQTLPHVPAPSPTVKKGAIPMPPTNVKAVAESANRLKVSWQPGGTSTAGYYVAFLPEKKAPRCLEGAKVYGTSFSRKDLHENAIITTSVCAFGASGLVSPQVSVTKTMSGMKSKENQTPPPPTPKDLVAVANSSTQLTMSWTSGGGNTEGFYLAFVPGRTATDCTNGMALRSTSYSRNDLSPGQTLTMTVCAFNPEGVVSSPISVTQTTLP